MTWIREYITNWEEYDAPIVTKLRLGVVNTARRLRGRPCCGHYGEPGC